MEVTFESNLAYLLPMLNRVIFYETSDESEKYQLMHELFNKKKREKHTRVMDVTKGQPFFERQ